VESNLLIGSFRSLNNLSIDLALIGLNSLVLTTKELLTSCRRRINITLGFRQFEHWLFQLWLHGLLVDHLLAHIGLDLSVRLHLSRLVGLIDLGFHRIAVGQICLLRLIHRLLNIG
jgi:hypothetical protein